MTKLRNYQIILFALLVFGCVTVDDLNTARDLNRLDLELSQNLNTAGKEDDEKKKQRFTELALLAEDAYQKANMIAYPGGTFTGDKNKRLVALAYYRISATAYWKTNEVRSNNRLLDLQEKAMPICDVLKENKPLRDCYFLSIVTLLAVSEQASDDSHFLPKNRDYLEVRDHLSFIKRDILDGYQQSITQNENYLRGTVEMKKYICEQYKLMAEKYKDKYSGLLVKAKNVVEKNKLDQWTKDFSDDFPIYKKGEDGNRASSACYVIKAAELCGDVFVENACPAR